MPTIRWALPVLPLILPLLLMTTPAAFARSDEPAAPDTAEATAADHIAELRAGRLPDLEFVTLEGDTLTLEDFRGKVVLLDFWGTWCPPCIASLPHLKRLVEETRDSPFLLVSISNDTDGDVLRSFIAENEMNWPQVWDEDQRLTGEIFVIGKYPTFVLVDPEGRIIHRQSGWSRTIERTLDARIMFALRAAQRTAR